MLRKILKRKFIILFLIILFLGGYFGYKNFFKKENQIHYILAKVEKGTIVVSVSGSGQIKSVEEVEIKPKIAGQIEGIYINKDQEVKTGQIIAQLDKKEKEKAVRDAQFSLDEAKENLEKAKKDYNDILAEYKKAKETTYQETLDNLREGYDSLALEISKLKTLYEMKSYKESESDFDYYISLVRSILTFRGNTNPLPFWSDTALNKFSELEESFNSLKKEHRNITRESSFEEVKNFLLKTYDFSLKFFDLVQNTKNLLEDYQEIIAQESLTPSISSSITNNQISQLKNSISKISELKNSFDKNKKTIEDLSETYEKKIDNAQSAIKTAENNLLKKEDAFSDAKEDLANCFIYAPFGGIVAKVNVKKGDNVSTGTSLATLITKQRIAEISLNEIDVAKIQLGQKATLTFDALPDLTLTGKVIEIDTLGAVNQGVVSYNVKIALDTNEEKIKPGMSTTAEIIVDVKTDVFVLPNSAIKTQRGLKYVELIDGSESLKRQLKIGSQINLPKEIQVRNQNIETGISNDSLTEVISGLEEGDIIISSKISSQTTQTRTTSNQLRFQIPGMGGGAPR